MKILQRAALVLAMSAAVATAQAAPFSCAYAITSGDSAGASAVHAVDATNDIDATNQTIAWIYRTFGAVGFEVRCSAP